MYWSRTTSLNGYSSWGGDDNLTDTPDSYHTQQSQVYCPATDTIVSTRITTDPSWYLSLALAIQPVLATLLFLISLTFSQMPLDWWVRHHCSRGRCDGEKSQAPARRLSEPVEMQITVFEPVAEAPSGGQIHPGSDRGQ